MEATAAGAAARTGPFYQLGKDCLRIPMELHAKNRTRLCTRLHTDWKADLPQTGFNGVFIVLQGGTDSYIGDSDSIADFRQVGVPSCV